MDKYKPGICIRDWFIESAWELCIQEFCHLDRVFKTNKLTNSNNEQWSKSANTAIMLFLQARLKRYFSLNHCRSLISRGSHSRTKIINRIRPGRKRPAAETGNPDNSIALPDPLTLLLDEDKGRTGLPKEQANGLRKNGASSSMKISFSHHGGLQAAAARGDLQLQRQREMDRWDFKCSLTQSKLEAILGHW